MSKDSKQLVSELAEKVKSIRLTEISALGSSNNQKVLLDLNNSTAELYKVVHADGSKEERLQTQDKLVQAVDTAGLTGLISNEELTEYYKLLDNIWATIEKE